MVMWHTDAISDSCLKCLSELRKFPFIQNFYLAGGTALALQIGHRISTDLDWFSSIETLYQATRESIQKELFITNALQVVSEQDGMLFTRFFDTDVSFLYQHHLLIEPPLDYQGIILASQVDIGLMKLAAINSRGTRRDFIDLYCMRKTAPLDRLLELAPIKFSDRPSFLSITARALAYFSDAEDQPMPRMLTPVQWFDVKAYCQSAARQLTRRLSGL
jgi:hypothetical protein